MGIYIYSVKKSSLRSILVDGVRVEAARLGYHYKPSWTWHPGNRIYEAQIARMESAWNGQTPEYVVIGDKYEEGAQVRGNWPKGVVSCDDYEFPGQSIGTLTRQGRGWAVVKNPPPAV
jgi:hypothetical protein